MLARKIADTLGSIGFVPLHGIHFHMAPKVPRLKSTAATAVQNPIVTAMPAPIASAAAAHAETDGMA
jgi:hypothetical protein